VSAPEPAREGMAGGEGPLRRVGRAVLDGTRILAGREPPESRYARLRARAVRRACRRAWKRRGDWLRPGAERAGAPPLDERVVELPWVYARLAAGPAGGLLDVGSTLNSAFHIRLLGSRFAALTFLNPYRDDGYRSAAPRVAYLVRDARAPGLPPGSVARITCISTLEHIGCDNTLYGGPAREAGGVAAGRARADAMRALRALLAPGGSLLLTVPYGLLEDRGWFVQLDRRSLDEAVAAFSPAGLEAAYFLFEAGWRAAGEAECASARYGERTPGASAVACLELRA